MPDVDEIADGIHRIATFVPEEGLTFNQFLLAGDEPLLFHTGPRASFRDTLAGIARIPDPTRLRWVSWSHFEADECGALNDFLELAPAAEPVHSELGAGLNGSDFAIRPVRTLADSQVLDLGGHRLQILITPHVPHGWDAITAGQCGPRSHQGHLCAGARSGEAPAFFTADRPSRLAVRWGALNLPCYLTAGARRRYAGTRPGEGRRRWPAPPTGQHACTAHRSRARPADSP